jgi:hypothetical protein
MIPTHDYSGWRAKSRPAESAARGGRRVIYSAPHFSRDNLSASAHRPPTPGAALAGKDFDA